jgi:hypothetical protein
MTTDEIDDPTLQHRGSADAWDASSALGALDELFTSACLYRQSAAYLSLLKFVAGFRSYAPFNAMLLHVQMPGATYVAPAHRWLRDHHRRIKPNGRPLVIVQPMGPVMFVFDVSDTEPTKDALPLPPGIERPFEPRSGHVGNQLGRTIDNAKRDGISVSLEDGGSQSAGSIRCAEGSIYLDVITGVRPKVEIVRLRRRYGLVLNSDHSPEAAYASLVHELAHLYCGHLGTPNNKWWPDRRELAKATRELEAESVCFLVCTRMGIDNPSAEYLADYVKASDVVTDISLDCVLKAAGIIEQMGRQQLPLRKDNPVQR